MPPNTVAATAKASLLAKGRQGQRRTGSPDSDDAAEGPNSRRGAGTGATHRHRGRAAPHRVAARPSPDKARGCLLTLTRRAEAAAPLPRLQPPSPLPRDVYSTSCSVRAGTPLITGTTQHSEHGASRHQTSPPSRGPALSIQLQLQFGEGRHDRRDGPTCRCRGIQPSRSARTTMPRSPSSAMVALTSATEWAESVDGGQDKCVTGAGVGQRSVEPGPVRPGGPAELVAVDAFRVDTGFGQGFRVEGRGPGRRLIHGPPHRS